MVIQFTQLQNGTIQLTQHGLIDQVYKATGMQDSNPDQTPASTKPLSLDKNGAPFNEQRSYASVVGMLLYHGAIPILKLHMLFINVLASLMSQQIHMLRQSNESFIT